MAEPPFTIHEYHDDLAAHFRDINAEWISAMFRLEPTDEEVLNDPRGRIIDRGGAILFAEAAGLGIVGTCALQRTQGSAFELTKMGVRETARGRKAGEFLLAAAIERAKFLGADPLYLLTNLSSDTYLCELRRHPDLRGCRGRRGGVRRFLARVCA